MLYEATQRWLGWPNSDQVFEPTVAGARVYAEFAQKKIGGALKLNNPDIDVKVGIIAADPNAAGAEAPLAVVCEFLRGARDEELDLAHRLAWNFSRAALLITLEPHRLIAWSCYLDPAVPETMRQVCKVESGNVRQQQEVRDLLHWVNLITHRAQRERPKQFPADGRADALLLKNLRYVRRQLLDMGLPKEFCHDLLARVIFTQFLFHRKDSDGNAFFSSRIMKRLCEEGVLGRYHENLASVLDSKQDTYALFRWMDERFNGDLFPGKEVEDAESNEAAWRAERAVVKKEHLQLLAELIRGDLDTRDRQLLLWPHYSFDTIPLEFISSVYEEFLAEERHRDKAYYTPPHLVDYVLDAVLPWDGENWNLRILDPCCGSGIFLVKAFQRLIHRWRLANKREPLISDLKPILAGNLVGVDKNPEAVRVASFSLYLAMADAIEPKYYATKGNAKVFPRLRGTRLLAEDFFEEQKAGFRSREDANSYDLVIGNAPWGDNSIKPERKANETRSQYNRRIAATLTPAQLWAKDHRWPVANNDIGPVFLGKSACLVKESGRVAMIQTASLLYWRESNAAKLRQRLFTEFTFDEVTNLSALRRHMFAEAIGAACVMVFGKCLPEPSAALYYFAPKRSGGFLQGFAVEPQDINTLTHQEAAEEPIVWPVLALGGRRDLQLVRRLSGFSNLAKLEERGEVVTRAGVIPGDRKKKLPDAFKNCRYFDATKFPDDVILEFDVSSVPNWTHPWIHGRDSTDFEPFKMPQLLIKQSFPVKSGRFRAALVKTSNPEWGVICKETYLTVRDFSPGAEHIRAAGVVYNSRLAAYFLSLTSSRVNRYITETLCKELVTVPLPSTPVDLSALKSFEDIDEETGKLFALTAAEKILIENFLHYSLPDALRKTAGPGRECTRRMDSSGALESELSDYANTFIRVVKGTFGRERKVAATIYTEPQTAPLPVRMITVHLDGPDRPPVSIERIQADGLLERLGEFHADQLKQRARTVGSEGSGFQRVAYLFHPGRDADVRVMNVTIVKPDECRYWTQSMAMRDADQLAGAIFNAARKPAAA
jgi:N-6 DNA Methylase